MDDKYCYQVLEGKIKVRCRNLICQICEAEDERILKSLVSKDQVYLHVEYPPKVAVPDLMKQLKRLVKIIAAKLFASSGNNTAEDIFGGRGPTGNIAAEMMQEYLEHRCLGSQDKEDQFILED